MPSVLVEDQIEEQTATSWHEAAAMLQCLKDPELKKTCRIVAVAQFAVEVGVKVYGEIYQKLIGRSR